MRNETLPSLLATVPSAIEATIWLASADAQPFVIAALIAGCFLAGSIPFSLLVGLAKGVDIRKVGSGNVGATNLGRALGRGYFFLGFSLDMLKGLIPVVLAGWAMGLVGSGTEAGVVRTLAWMACAFAGVLGHVFSPWLKFRGGKGVATAMGVMLGLFPVLTLASAGVLVVFLACLGTTRIMSLSAMVGGMTLPAWTLLVLWLRRTGDGPWLTGAGWCYLGLAMFLVALVVWTHRANIARLRAGTEPKIGQRVSGAKSI
jgi:acyl phosphate:glycerol-3-phosphate acyltransferase